MSAAWSSDHPVAPGSPGQRRLSGRNAVLVLAIIVAFAVASTSGERAPGSARALAADADTPLFRFVSMPDFLNTDVGDTRLRAGRGWEPGDPNSLNTSWARAVNVILDEVQTEDPDVVLVAGDLVEGHWGIDADGTGIFGPTGTRAQRLTAVTNAGNLYYGEWAKRFRERGLRVLPALGDHEVGDNPWNAGSFKLAAVPTYKRVWARHFTRSGTGYRYVDRPIGTAFEETAYAVRMANTLFVSIDVFRVTHQSMTVTVSGGQLAWLDGLLGRARADGVQHIVVQGHTPVLGPLRSRSSSRLTMAGGGAAPFWQVLKRHNVDLYLSGEMHDITTQTDGVLQVVHGGLSQVGDANYLVGDVYADRIELRLEEMSGSVTDATRRLWQTSSKRPPAGISLLRGAQTVGTMVIDTSSSEVVYRDRTGLFLDWVP